MKHTRRSDIQFWRSCDVLGSEVCMPLPLFVFTLTTRDTLEAAVLGAIDYKKTLSKTYVTEADKEQAYSDCHRRSAERVLKALLANGGTSSTSVQYRSPNSSLVNRNIHKARTTYLLTVSELCAHYDP